MPLVLWRIGSLSRSGWDRMTFQPALKATSANDRETEQRSVYSMLYTIAVVLLILWFYALVGRRPL